MIHKITLTPDQLMSQSVETAKHYMVEAIKAVDGRFGDGFSQKNPEMVAAFMKTAADDFMTAIFAQNIQNLCEYISDINKTAKRLRSE